MSRMTSPICAALVGLATLPACVAALPLQPVIATLYYDETGADGTHVYTEIGGPAGYALDGWQLVGINGANGTAYRHIALDGATIPAGGILLLATAGALDAVLAARDFIANVDWQNGPDAVQLLDATGAVADALQYGNARSNNAGEGAPAVDVTAGMALARDALLADTGDNAADFGATAPVPRAGLSTPPLVQAPEPAWLWLAALPTLWWMRRRRPAMA